ncbi:MAG: hypothetical protein AAB414_03030 [Patescibacteria group bacterium]
MYFDFTQYSKQKGFAPILILVGILIITAIGGAVWFNYSNEGNPPVSDSNRTKPVQNPVVTSTPQPSPTSSSTTLTTKSNTDSCVLVSNSSFRSTKQYDGGMGPNGRTALAYWNIHLKTGNTLSDYDKPTFEWTHTDISESGSYTCQNNILEVQLYNRTLTANYNEDKEILTWDGVEYERVK